MQTCALPALSTRAAGRFRVVTGQEFDRLLVAWFGNTSRVLATRARYRMGSSVTASSVSRAIILWTHNLNNPAPSAASFCLSELNCSLFAAKRRRPPKPEHA